MKKLIITCALLTSASIVSFAQSNAVPQAAPPAMTSEQMAQRRTALETKQFDLNPEQAKKVLAVNIEFQNAIEKYRAEGKQPGQGQMGNLMGAKDAKMKQILTPEQYAKYDAIRNKQRMGPKAPNPNTAPAAAPAEH